MEEHFLKEYVSGVSREPTRPWYNPDGDCIVYQMVDEAIIAQRVDPILTLYRSAITDKPIGYQIKGVAALANRFGWNGILVNCTQDTDGLKHISLYALGH
jgi:hypothetical protein